MGLKSWGGSGAYRCPETGTLPNPNPERFVIESVEVQGSWVLATVRYPDATNFEGRKLLLYRDLTERELRDARRLDPHFTGSRQAPIARFEPSPRGYRLARELMKLK